MNTTVVTIAQQLFHLTPGLIVGHRDLITQLAEGLHGVGGIHIRPVPSGHVCGDTQKKKHR